MLEPVLCQQSYPWVAAGIHREPLSGWDPDGCGQTAALGPQAKEQALAPLTAALISTAINLSLN